MALVCVLFWDVGFSSPLRSLKTHHQLCDLPRPSHSLHRVSVSISQPNLNFSYLLFRYPRWAIRFCARRRSTGSVIFAQFSPSTGVLTYEDHRFSLGNSKTKQNGARGGGKTNVIMMHRGSPSMIMQATSKTSTGGVPGLACDMYFQGSK